MVIIVVNMVKDGIPILLNVKIFLKMFIVLNGILLIIIVQLVSLILHLIQLVLIINGNIWTLINLMHLLMNLMLIQMNSIYGKILIINVVLYTKVLKIVFVNIQQLLIVENLFMLIVLGHVVNVIMVIPFQMIN